MIIQIVLLTILFGVYLFCCNYISLDSKEITYCVFFRKKNITKLFKILQSYNKNNNNERIIVKTVKNGLLSYPNSSSNLNSQASQESPSDRIPAYIALRDIFESWMPPYKKYFVKGKISLNFLAYKYVYLSLLFVFLITLCLLIINFFKETGMNEKVLYCLIVVFLSSSIALFLLFLAKTLLKQKLLNEYIVDSIENKIITEKPKNGDLASLAKFVEAFSKYTDSNYSEHLSLRNELWLILGQIYLSLFSVTCIIMLLILEIISSEAGLAIITGISGFSIAKGVKGLNKPSNNKEKYQINDD